MKVKEWAAIWRAQVEIAEGAPVSKSQQDRGLAGGFGICGGLIHVRELCRCAGKISMSAMACDDETLPPQEKARSGEGMSYAFGRV